MKKRSLLGTTALMGLILVSGVPVMAATSMAPQKKAATSAVAPASQKKAAAPAASSFYAKQVKETSAMMGQVNLARHALDLGMNKDAADHIAKAREIAGKLEKQSPELSVASTLRAGNKVYTFNDDYKDYLIPVVDDLFTTGDYNVMVKAHKQKDEVAENDVETGRFKLSLDIRNVEKALDQSGSLASAGKISQARTALNGIYVGAVETAEAYEDPLWAVQDNLRASHSMILNKDYDGARYALKDAEKELKAIKTVDKYSGDSGTIIRLEKEISTLNDSLSSKDPTAIQKAEKTVSGWLNDVRNIGHNTSDSAKM